VLAHRLLLSFQPEARSALPGTGPIVVQKGARCSICPWVVGVASKMQD
jgi:hypothetical protein